VPVAACSHLYLLSSASKYQSDTCYCHGACCLQAEELETGNPTSAEEIRRQFAVAWGEIGAAWGVAPSTATVQGYLLAHGGPLTEPELRRALGMSHRAASLALAQCFEWGLIRQADTARRSGQRGPAAAAWVPVGDHWEWFRRVATARRDRETEPVMPVIDRCVALATTAASDGEADAVALRDRLSGLRDFVRQFDRGVEMFVKGQPQAIARLFAALEELDAASVARLWSLIDALEPGEMAAALKALAKLPPPATRRLIALADQPVLKRLLGVK
jgi:DNA-binding transcriptional regulator GbsR (MarR family)